MADLQIIPSHSAGPLKLNASPDDILKQIQELYASLAGFDPIMVQKGIVGQEIDVTKDSCSDGDFTFRYISDMFWFLVTYRDNRAVEISVDRLIREWMPVTLCGFDLFETPADELIPALKGKAPCVCDTEDEDLGYEYRFDTLGVRFWREDVFHPKLLQDENYVQEMAEVLEDQKHFRYFNIVSIY